MKTYKKLQNSMFLLRMRTATFIAVLVVMFGAVNVAPAFIYNESIAGDLSNNGLAPMVLVPELGDNILTGEIEYPDDDFFAFTIPTGWDLDAIVLLNHNTLADTTFLGIEDSPVYVTGQGNSNYFGYVSFDQGDIGDDLLSSMASSNHNFNSPLSVGDYSFWLDESNGFKEYSFNFQFVPEPATVLILGLGGLVLRLRKR